MRNCHIHGIEVEDKGSCPNCLHDFATRTEVNKMTPEERAAELHTWYDTREIEFSMLHQRIEELVGRPIWTHELIDKEGLTQEILGTRGTPNLLDTFPKDKPVIVVGIDNERR